LSVDPKSLLVPRRQRSFFDPEEIEIRLARGETVEITARVTSWKIIGSAMELNIQGVKALAPLIRLGDSAEQILLRLRTTNVWTLRKVQGVNMVSNVRPVIEITENEYQLVSKLLEEYTPAELIIMGMGYRPEPEIYSLLLPRLMAIVADPPFHVLQLTAVESGKTFFGTWSMYFANFYWMTSPPTIAGLVYDARSGTHGVWLVSDGIVFDELDKWSDVYVKQANLVSYLPSLMENCVAVRPTTRLKGFTYFEKCNNTIWFGNIGRYISGEPMRIAFDMFMKLGDEAGAILDRIDVVHVDFSGVRILDYVTNMMFPDNIMYALIQTTRKRIPDIEFRSRLSGRRKRHSINIQRALFKLGINIEPGDADAVVDMGWQYLAESYGKTVFSS